LLLTDYGDFPAFDWPLLSAFSAEVGPLLDLVPALGGFIIHVQTFRPRWLEERY